MTGATGDIGRHVVAGLHARGVSVRALSRSGGRFPDGVEVVSGDLTAPETLRPALSEVDSVFLLWPFLTAQGASEVVQAISQHARHVVYVSALSAADGSGVWSEVEEVVQRLRELQDAGLVARAEMPPHVEYSLTEEGRSLGPALQALYDRGVLRAARTGVVIAPA